MNAKKIIPLFCTPKLAETEAFYTGHLGFEVSVEAEGYLGLRAGEEGPELSFMNPPDGVPPAAKGEGLLYCLEVEDVDREHERLVAEGVEITDPPQDKEWGDRCATLFDPNGIMIYLYHPIAVGVASDDRIQ